MPTSSTISSVRKTEEMPIDTSTSTVIRATKVETMNTSPCAKFTMPMMPNTMV